MTKTTDGWLQRMSTRPTRRAVLAMTAGAAVVPALAGRGWAQAAKSGGILRVVQPANPASLDPLTGGQDTELKFLMPMFDTLIAWNNETLQAEPQLATKWSYPDDTTLVLDLRDDVTFHDGTRFDATAVKKHLDRAMGEGSAVRSDLSSIDSVEVTSPTQVTLHLKQPDAALPLILSDRAGMINSPTALEQAGPDNYKRAPVGTGPWKFESWMENDTVSQRRYDGYYGDPVYLDGLDHKIISDPNTAARSVMSGENQFAHRLFPQQKVIADRMGKTQQVVAPTMACYQVVFNQSRKGLDDKRVRQAINFAVDREAFNQISQLGLGKPASTLLPDGYWAHDPKNDGFFSHDPDKARALLKEAGYDSGLTLNLYGYNDQAAQQRSEALMEQLRLVGIDVQLTAGIPADINPRFFAKGEGDICLTLWSGRPDPAQTFSIMYAEKGFINVGHVAPPEDYQQALVDIRKYSDEAKRKEAFSTIERLTLENAFSASLYFAPEIDILSPAVKDYVPNTLGRPKFNKVWLDA